MKSFCTPTTCEANSSDAGDGEAEHAVDADHRQPLLLAQGERVAEAPGVDEQVGPADGHHHQHDPDEPEHEGVAQQPEDERAEDHPEPEEHRDDRDQPEPDPQRDPPGLLAAGHELGRAGEHERHQHQHERPAELDAAGLRAPRDADARCATGKGGRHGGRPLAVEGWPVGADKYHQPHASHGDGAPSESSTALTRSRVSERPSSISALRASRWARRISASRIRRTSSRALRSQGRDLRAASRRRRSPRTRGTPRRRAPARCPAWFHGSDSTRTPTSIDVRPAQLTWAVAAGCHRRAPGQEGHLVHRGGDGRSTAVPLATAPAVESTSRITSPPCTLPSRLTWVWPASSVRLTRPNEGGERRRGSCACTVASAPCLRVGGPADPAQDPSRVPKADPATAPTTAGSTAASPTPGDRRAHPAWVRRPRADPDAAEDRPPGSPRRRGRVRRGGAAARASRCSRPSRSRTPKKPRRKRPDRRRSCCCCWWPGWCSWSPCRCGRGARSTRSTSSRAGDRPGRAARHDVPPGRLRQPQGPLEGRAQATRHRRRQDVGQRTDTIMLLHTGERTEHAALDPARLARRRPRPGHHQDQRGLRASAARSCSSRRSSRTPASASTTTSRSASAAS